jgi:hypothetical protein
MLKNPKCNPNSIEITRFNNRVRELQAAIENQSKINDILYRLEILEEEVDHIKYDLIPQTEESCENEIPHRAQEVVLGKLCPEQMFILSKEDGTIVARIDDDGTVRLSKNFELVKK